VMPSSTVFTDEFLSYNPLEGAGYQHKRVNHSQNVYVDGTASTNTIESFWSPAKRGIDGVNHSVSCKQSARVNPYAFRWNHRDASDPMFFELLNQIPFCPEIGRVILFRTCSKISLLNACLFFISVIRRSGFRVYVCGTGHCKKRTACPWHCNDFWTRAEIP